MGVSSTEPEARQTRSSLGRWRKIRYPAFAVAATKLAATRPLSRPTPLKPERFSAERVEHFLKYHADVMSLVGRRMQADPHFALGHCRKG